MASNEGSGVTTGQPNLHKQDLSKLDVSKLTALSQEVISRQATINIGTIGHVAHGKSTVVKAISGVQTVRFKNELERNITIKLERLQFDANGAITWPKHMRKVPVSKASWGELRAELTRKRKRESDKLNDYLKTKPVPYTREYVVERIVRHKIVPGGQQLFYVKWKDYADEHNTWEPVEHLEHCPKAIEEFFSEKISEKTVKALCERLEISMKRLQNGGLSKMVQEVDLNSLPLKCDLQKELLKFVDAPPAPSHVRRIELGRKLVMQYYLLVRREKQLKQLADWEVYINTSAAEEPVIKVENNVDLEEPPWDFVYTNRYIAGQNITIPYTPTRGCECVECGPKEKQCCGRQEPLSFTYRRNRRINIIPGMAIYECNDLCKCLPDCRNRVVQQGRQVPLCIFRTSNGCGWGVKALRKIYYGEFICEYVGEVITHEEAEIRGRKYDAKGLTYLFDLDYDSKDNPYTVDAAKYGNVSHFINHSCDPNLAVWAVWINCSDPNLPQLALFSLREIEKGEELTFDYMTNNMGSPSKNSPEKQRPKLKTPEKNQVLAGKSICKCTADSCRRYLFG